MNEKLTDERISAYLDDELSAEERADIERQLAESADLRLAVEELRALHAGMQSLPRYKLESSIADRVLQLAEREILVGGRAEGGRADNAPIVTDTNGQALAAADNRPQPASLPTSAPLSQQESVRQEAWFSWRNLVWSASAAAVAALVTNYYHVNNLKSSSHAPSVSVATGDPKQPGDGNAAKKEAEQSNARAMKDRPDAEFAAASQGSAKLESAKLESAELRSTDSGLPSTESSTESALSKKPGATADGNASADRSADNRNAGAGSAGAANADAFDRPTRGGNSGNEAPDTTMAADSAAGASSLAQRRARAGHSSKHDANAQSANKSHGFGGGPRSAADGKPAVDGEAEGEAAGDLAMNDEAASAALSGQSQMFLGGPSVSSSATTNVVTLAVSPEAWQRREFDKLLIANRVAMISDTSNGGANDGGAKDGGANNGGAAAEEMFVLDVTQEQFAELLKAVDVRSDAFAVIKEFAVDDATIDEEAVAGDVAAGAAGAASDAAPSNAAASDPARSDPARSVAAAPSIAQGALRSTDVGPRVRGTPRETNPMRFSRGSDNPPPGAARPNALPPAAVEAPAVDAPRSVDPAPTPEPKAMPKPQALPEEQSPPPAKATEAEPSGGRREKSPDKTAPADAPADKPTRVKSPEKKPGDDRPAPAADAVIPPSVVREAPKADAPEALRPELQKGETMPAESESANSARPAPRSLAGEGAQTEKKAEAKSFRPDDPEQGPRSRADSLVPDSFASDDAANEKFEALAAPEGFARRIVPRPRTSSAEARTAPPRYSPEAVEPPSPVPPPEAPNKAIPDAVAEDAQGDKPANVESGKPNRKQIVDGPAEAPAVDRVAGPSPRVRVYFLLRPTYRVPARTELAAPGDVEPSPVAPPAPAADAGPTEVAPAAPAPQ